MTDYIVEITANVRVYVENAESEDKAHEYALDQVPSQFGSYLIDGFIEVVPDDRKELERRHADFIAEDPKNARTR